MREGEPSRTAFGAATYRAVHQDLDGGRVFRDPLAWQVLGVDFETDDLVSRLVESGFDPTAPAFFLWLGVVPYLTEADLIARVAEFGEPLSAGLETEALHTLLADLGFGEVEDLGRPQIRERFLGLPGGTETGGAHLLRARA